MLSLISFAFDQNNNQIIVENVSNDLIMELPWGMNAHLTFPKTKDHVNELCRSMQKAHVQMVRLDVYWWYDNMFLQQDLCDRAVYYANKYNLEVLLNFPQLPNRTDTAFVRDWLDMIISYANRYDGKHAIKIEGEREIRYPKVRYFEVLNEVELNSKKKNLSVADVFMLIKNSSETLHNMSLVDKPVVLYPGISPFNEFAKNLIQYQENGKTLFDYVDILNLHLYPNNTEDFIYIMELWKKRIKEFNYEAKPLWITELGNTLWDVSEKKQAYNLFKQYILSMSYGIERIFYYQYHSFGGNYFNDKHQKEEFYGIIENSNSKSFISFLENDGIFQTAISEGDGLGKIFIADSLKASLYTITDKMCKKLKEKGVAVGGKGFTINKISIKSSTGNEHILWEGNWPVSNQNSPLQIPCKMFKNISSKDILLAYISNVKGFDEWQGVKPLLAYYTYQYLSSILNEGSTRPVIEKKSNGLYIAYWRYKGAYYYAIWNDKNNCETITIDDKSNVLLFQCNGKRMQLKTKCIHIGNSPVILESKVRMLKFI